MAENYSFSVILEPQDGGGFTVLVPALPEVVTEGDSEKEALANAQEAIRAVFGLSAGQRHCDPRLTPTRKFVTLPSPHNLAAARLPAVPGTRVVRALSRVGFVVDRIVGSHHIMKHPGDPTRTVTVPCHSGRDLKPAAVVIRQTGLSVERFNGLL